MIKTFFDWYNRHYQLNLRLATLLFILQLVHLVWLTCNVVLFRLLGVHVFPSQLDWLVAAIDYAEIPALVSVSFIYINDIFLGKAIKKAWLYLLLLNSQWIHLFWITDEIILESFTGQAIVAIPVWLAWIAILVDYLELPVIYDTVRRSLNPILFKKNQSLG